MRERLWDILTKEFSGYEEWLNILSRKKHAVYNEDIDEIDNLNKQELMLSKRLKALEVEREDIINKCFNNKVFSDIFPDKPEWLSDFKNLIKKVMLENEQVRTLVKYMLNYHRNLLVSINKAINNLTYSTDKKNNKATNMFNIIDFQV